MAEVFGIPINDPPEGWICVEAIVIVKAVSASGGDAMFIRNSKSLYDVEALGMIAAAHRSLDDSVAECFEDDEGEGTDAADEEDDDG